LPQDLNAIRKKLLHLLNNSKEVIGTVPLPNVAAAPKLFVLTVLSPCTGNPPLLSACILLVPDVLLPNDDEMARSFTLVLSDHFVNSADQGTP
jgi:hypothetical protein